jgi:hypothetical protein
MTVSYFADHPEIVKIFNDLDSFRDFCRYEGFVFDEKFLYKKESKEWRAYENRGNPRKAKNRVQKNRGFKNRKPKH